MRGTWENGQKHGPAQVICSNGYSVYASNLFQEDCVSLIPPQAPPADRDTMSDKPSHLSSQQQLYHVPVNAASHEIDVTFYLDRLNNYLVECKRRGKQFKKPATPNQFESTVRTFSNRNDSKKQETTSDLMPTESTADSDVEEVSLRNIILQYLSALKMVYNKYSEMCCDVKPKSLSVLMRLMLWQLFRDCNLHSRGYSLSDLDILIGLYNILEFVVVKFLFSFCTILKSFEYPSSPTPANNLTTLLYLIPTNPFSRLAYPFLFSLSTNITFFNKNFNLIVG